MEKTTDLDEAKLLGYFETIRSVFLTKFIFLVAALKEKDGKKYIDLPEDAIKAVSDEFDDPIFYKAIRKGNEEVYLNFFDDMYTSLFTSSWNVFEQVIKDLSKANYANDTEELSVTYQSGRFQFDKREKKDIDLFYYIRNAIYHYNGAYFAVKDVNHRYGGADFVSQGHHGEKIDIKAKVAWQMALDLQKYTIKAWSNAKSPNALSQRAQKPAQPAS